MESVVVDLGDRSYPIHIGAGLIRRGDLLAPHVAGRHVVVISNETVAPLYLDTLREALSGFDVVAAVVPDGESAKTLDQAGVLFDRLIDARCDRRTTVIALGGGVVGDLAGFVAACYQRGVPYIQVPTTLLAQVDSSVGGKTGVNHPRGKNMIGAFHQPRCVLADTETLRTLPQRQVVSGIAEVVKYGAIRDAGFLDWLERRIEDLVDLDHETVAAAIAESCRAKAAVVAEDERESGLRAILNFGHTFGHAIETATGYTSWLHGEAVAAGMVMAADMSVRMGWLAGADGARLRALLLRAGLPAAPPESMRSTDFLDAMQIDKKVDSGKIRLVLLRGLGNAVVTADYPDGVLLETIEHALAAGTAA